MSLSRRLGVNVRQPLDGMPRRRPRYWKAIEQRGEKQWPSLLYSGEAAKNRELGGQ